MLKIVLSNWKGSDILPLAISLIPLLCGTMILVTALFAPDTMTKILSVSQTDLVFTVGVFLMASLLAGNEHHGHHGVLFIPVGIGLVLAVGYLGLVIFGPWVFGSINVAFGSLLFTGILSATRDKQKEGSVTPALPPAIPALPAGREEGR